MFSLICARINACANNWNPGDLRRHRAHYYVIVMRNGRDFGDDIFKCIFENENVQMLFSDWSLDHSTGIVIMGMLWGNNDGKPSLVLEMAWCHQATSHCMDQCWQRPMTPYGVTRPQLVNWFWCTNAYTIENSNSFSDFLLTIAAKITTKANGAKGNYSDVIMSAMAFQITGVSIVYSTVWSRTENIKAPRHWSLWGEFTGDRWIPRTMCQ